MRKTHRVLPVALALVLASTSISCLVSRRVIKRGLHPAASGRPPALLTATRDQLNERIARIYDGIHSFQATVDMTPSKGSVYTGAITEIKDVHAFILFRKPSDIRIIGQLPVVRTRAFDMVSNGENFRLYLNSRNLFVEGSNSAPATSKNTLENLRPSAFLSSMLIRPASPGESPSLVDDTDEEEAFYILAFITKGPNGDLLISRAIWFDRVDLTIVRQKVFDTAGEIVSDTRYSKWQEYDNVPFPAHIDINRPKDGYGVIMDVTQMKMNADLSDDKFQLPQPEGSQLKVIGAEER